MLSLEFWGRKSKKQRGKEKEKEEGLRDVGSAGIPRPPVLPTCVWGHSLLHTPDRTRMKRKAPPGAWSTQAAPMSAPLPILQVHEGTPSRGTSGKRKRDTREKPRLAACSRCKITIKATLKLFQTQAGEGEEPRIDSKCPFLGGWLQAGQRGRRRGG